MKAGSEVSVRKAFDLCFVGLVYLFSSLIFLPLIAIFVYMVMKGLPALSFDLLTHLPRPVGSEYSGISNAIVGSLILIAIASLIAVPLGILIGIHLYEYKQARMTDILRLCMDVLQGVPSIIVGIVVYVWVVLPLNSFSALSGGIALALMMLPVIARSTEETMNLILPTYKEAALALGVPYYTAVFKVVLRSAGSGVLTGIVLSVARIAGETAPLLFTAFGNQFMSYNVFKPILALPLLIFNYATSPYEEWQAIAWGAALLLILFIFMLSIGVKLLSYEKK
ncbi:MAG: phosphate ABC transporter permease PstA [bacterium]